MFKKYLHRIETPAKHNHLDNLKVIVQNKYILGKLDDSISNGIATKPDKSVQFLRTTWCKERTNYH